MIEPTNGSSTHELAPVEHGCPILVDDDDDDLRDALADMLDTLGYRVDTAANGKEALDHLNAMERPCVVLLDLMMPVMTGDECLAQIRADENLSNIPVVVVSAWQDKAARVPTANGFIGKPVDIPVLLDYLARYC